MPTFANKLDELLADTVLASGTLRQVALNKVRDYLQTTPVAQLQREVQQVTSLQSLRMLQAAGVPLGLQAAYLARFESLSAGQR